MVGTPSSQGSAEVIARGTNSYTNTWSDSSSISTIESAWTQWNNYPSVVRIGNFVYCFQRLIHHGGARIVTYTLIDIVPDPNDPTRLGDNVAYPYITSTSPSVDRVLTGYNTEETVSEKSFVLDVENKEHLGYQSGATQDRTYGGYFQTSYSTYEKVLLSFTDGSVSSARVSRTSSGSDPERLYGWGGVNYLKQADGSYYTTNAFQYIHAPVFDYNQFVTLYGSEADWSLPKTTSFKWLFESGDASYPLVYTTNRQLPRIPFTIQTPTSNTATQYKDTDVVEEFDQFTVGAAAFVLGSLDVTKCKFDINTKAIEEALADVKNTIAGAIDSTGLLEIKKKAEGFRDALVANLPQIPEILNLSDIVSSLDLSDLNAVKLFKEKYGALVDDIDALIDKIKLPDFDICSLFNIEGVVDASGNVKKKDSGVRSNNPNKSPEEPPRNTEVPQIGASQPISNDIGLTKENSEAALKYIASQWELVIAPFGVGYDFDLAQSVIASARKKLREFYQSFQGEKEITSQALNDSIRQDYIDRRLKRRVGRYYRGDAVVGFDIYEEEDLKRDTEMIEEILNQIDEYIFTDEMIQNYRVLSIADPKDYTRTTDTPQEPNTDGDIVSEPVSSVKGSKGNVTDDFKNATRNKPIQSALRSILEQVSAETETSIVIYSAGQDPKGTPNARRTGSIRHDNGYAADIRIYKDDRRLTALRSSDHEDLTEIVKSLKKAGIGSVGAGPGYMNGNLHVDIADRVGQGQALTWGAGGRSANTPSWLRTAFYG